MFQCMFLELFLPYDKLTLHRKGSTSLHMGSLNVGSVLDYDTSTLLLILEGLQALIDTVQRRLVEVPLLNDPVITRSMTDQEKIAAQIQIDRNNLARTIRQDMQLNKEKRRLRDRQFLNLQPFPSPTSTPMPQPQHPYIEPGFMPQITQYEFDLIFNYLVRSRDQLALETLHFEIPEHQLYWYILRSGFTGLEAWQWRGFLQQCEDAGVLFS